VPRSAVERALGVGNHLRFADVRPSDTVLDLGCGGGIDTILAARRAGPAGRVIALDFLPEMLERTAHAGQEAGLENVQTLEGELEAIPLPDASVDLIISNGVINLSERKARVMAECARSLRPGGRLCVSDSRSSRTTSPRRYSPSRPPGRAVWPVPWRRTTSSESSRKLDSATSRSRTERR
jgi:arsenite methyltransferase